MFAAAGKSCAAIEVSGDLESARQGESRASLEGFHNRF